MAQREPAGMAAEYAAKRRCGSAERRETQRLFRIWNAPRVATGVRLFCVEYGFVWNQLVAPDGVSPGVELWNFGAGIHHNDSVSVRRSDDDFEWAAFGPDGREILARGDSSICVRGGVGRGGARRKFCRVGRLLRDCLRRRAMHDRALLGNLLANPSRSGCSRGNRAY